MRLRDRLSPQTITGQITGLVAIAVLLGIALTATVFLLLQPLKRPSSEPESVAANIATIVRLAEAAHSPDEMASLLAAARRAGFDVRAIGPGELAQPPHAARAKAIFWNMVLRRLDTSWGIAADDGSAAGSEGRILIKLSDGTLLVFLQPLKVSILPKVIFVPAALALTIITISIVFLSLYAVRWIISPLSSMAYAAQAFGRSSDNEPIAGENGPREISRLAQAFNEMRLRIQTLIDDRTRMLVAISHDLRTPLTRLRLRAERISGGALREGLLHDISQIDSMLGDALTYLREGAHPENMQGVDLPSLLQTICAEFTDVGYAVSYEGPHRFAYICRPGALTRAINNIVENGTKHGSLVAVKLLPLSGGNFQIEVADDGPGIPLALKEKALQPFFKGDSARTPLERAGFGLGLSIASDIIKAHGGAIGLFDRTPKGLIVRISLQNPAEGQ
jgi:signal transduction histidine kinase